MEQLIKIDTIDDYNRMYGFETKHPLVSVVDLNGTDPPQVSCGGGLQLRRLRPLLEADLLR